MTRSLLLASAFALAMVLPATPAHAEIVDVPTPSDSCLASASAAVGLTDALGGQTTTLDIEGPVQQVVIEWGGIWEPAPLDPTIGVEVVGPDGTDASSDAGTEATDPTGLSGSPATAYGYSADITDLFGTGAPGSYSLTITPPLDGIDGGENRWYGATVTAIYDDSPCDVAETAIWRSGADFYFGGDATSSPTTDLIVLDWGYPLTEDYTGTVTMSHGGADHTATTCRASSIWVATGSASAPTATEDLVDDGGVPNPAYNGTEGVVMPWTPPGQPCPPTVTTSPVVGVTGGDVGAEWGLLEIDVAIPAGSTWLAFQLESPRDNGGHPGYPVAGTWGSSVLILPAALPDITLEKTVLDGAATCPGIEGTDELVSGDAGTPVTYCFRVISSGPTSLFPVEIDDPGLDITHADMTLVSGDDTVPLAPGDELVYSYETTITGDLPSTAAATGWPEGGTNPAVSTNAAAVELYTITAVLEAFCEADAPYLAYDITTNAPGSTATITFTGDGASESFGVDMPSGLLLWPGAAVDAGGAGIDWPGWDQDADGNWFENPANPYAWARGDVEVTVTVNPTTDPVTITYPPGTATCSTAPPPNDPAPTDPPTDPTDPPASETPAPAVPPSAEPPLPVSGVSVAGLAGLGTVLAMIGAAFVLLTRRLARR